MNLLIDALIKLKAPYDDNTIGLFQSYMEQILEWNEKVNLTSITDKEGFIKKHFVDSITCYDAFQYQEANKIIDIGTGAGFPGIPLAIISPEKSFVLVDSLKKRLNIIDEIAKGLGIQNVTLCHGRAEDLARSKEHREQYDLCLSRAVANLNVLSEYCLPFVRVGGWFGAYKSKNAEEELNSSKSAIKKLSGSIEEIKNFEMNGYDLDHNIIFIKKTTKSLAKYPRKAGTPAKEPLK
ncbi:MAG: 16S rRNA (guanine(527)-N(7))-methyltransferase RsmG [Anaerovoracaceae bacterium]|jgi:16S rRNA (guanine527-N7)-methyltransferase